MRTALVGAVGSTATALRAMQAAGHPPLLVGTFDPQTGAKRHSDYVDLAGIADSRVAVRHIHDVNDPDFVARLHDLDLDFLFVIGWSQIVRREAQAAARHFAIGYHPTALPEHRGRAPLAWTILLGLERTGSSLFVIDEGVDSGAILAQESFDLGPRETIPTLLDKHLAALDRMMGALVLRLAAGDLSAEPQDAALASYCAVRRPDDGLIDWTRDAAAIDRLVRACSRPYPGAFTYTRKRRVAVWRAEPVRLPNRHFAQPGQVVFVEDGKPVVLCGDSTYLRIDEYETADGAPITGQPRFFSTAPAGGSPA